MVAKSSIITWTNWLIALPSLVAISFYPYWTNVFEWPKQLMLWAILLVFMVGLLIKLMWKKQLSAHTHRLKHPLVKGLGLFWSLMLISSFFSPYALNSIWGSDMRAMGILFWLSIGIFFLSFLLFVKREQIYSFIRITGITSTLIAIHAIFQRLGVDPILGNLQVAIFEGRVFSTLGNPNFLAQFLVPVMLMLGVYSYQEKKFTWIPSILLMAVALVFTESRASLLALVTVGGFATFIQSKHKSKILIAALLMLAFVSLGAFLDWPLFDRLQFNVKNMRSVQSRLVLWKMGLNMILDHPILGIGLENLGAHFNAYMDPTFYTLEETIHMQADRTHNETLQMGLIGGLPLMFTYLGIFAYTAWTAYKKKNWLYTLPLLSIFIQNQFTFSLQSHVILLTALMASWSTMDAPKQKAQTWKPRKALIFTFAPAMLLLMLLVSRPLLLHRAAAQMWYTVALSSNETEYALIRAIELNPLQTEWRYNLMMWFPEHTEGQLEALEQIEGPSIDVLAWKANAMSVQDPEASYSIYEEVIAINPNYPHTLRAYADTLYRNGEYTQAAEYYERYFQNVPEFWSWCPDHDQLSDYDKKRYRVFHRDVADFTNSILHIYESYLYSGNQEKALEWAKYVDCFNLLGA